MSWEGYYYQLCSKGHLTEPNAEYREEDKKCSICGEDIVWYNIVDVTNGSFDDDGNRIDGYIELKEKEKRICEHCGTVLEILYEKPKEE